MGNTGKKLSEYPLYPTHPLPAVCLQVRECLGGTERSGSRKSKLFISAGCSQTHSMRGGLGRNSPASGRMSQCCVRCGPTPRTAASWRYVWKLIITPHNSFLKSVVLFYYNSGPLRVFFLVIFHKWIRGMHKETYSVNLQNLKNYLTLRDIYPMCICCLCTCVSLSLQITSQTKPTKGEGIIWCLKMSKTTNI